MAEIINEKKNEEEKWMNKQCSIHEPVIASNNDYT